MRLFASTQAFAAAMLFAATGAAADDHAAPASGGERPIVFADEFDGPALDRTKWNVVGMDFWVNNEQQAYVDSPDTIQFATGIEGADGGALVLRPVYRPGVDTNAGRKADFISGRIHSSGKAEFTYGRIEARIRMPKGQGLWPAFWLLPQDNAYGTWAASGEIDIVEATNPGATGGNTIYGTLHYGGQFPNNVLSGEQYAVSTDITADFHTYVLEWDQAEIRWYVDSILFAVRNTWFTTAAPFPAPFDQRFYILLNLAVGGNFPGPPAASTVFPVTMEVDYVRVYSGSP